MPNNDNNQHAKENIKEKKLIYHLTSLRNMNSILSIGLQPRSYLKDKVGFFDIANKDIIKDRQEDGLDGYIPFHWFSSNPFDGQVQKNHPNEDFVLITVRRSLAKEKNWLILTQHPLSNKNIKPMSYAEGFEKINWELMNQRNYHQPDCKNVCMAECLSPEAVAAEDFFRIYVKNNQVANKVWNIAQELDLKELEIEANPNMFYKCATPT